MQPSFSESCSVSSNNSFSVRKVIDLANKFPKYPKKKDNNRNFKTIGDDIEDSLLKFSSNSEQKENVNPKYKKLKLIRRNKRKATPFFGKKDKKIEKILLQNRQQQLQI